MKVARRNGTEVGEEKLDRMIGETSISFIELLFLGCYIEENNKAKLGPKGGALCVMLR